MTTREIARQKRAEHSDPINFTCGKCHQVHEFDPDDPYACPLEAEVEDDE